MSAYVHPLEVNSAFLQGALRVVFGDGGESILGDGHLGAECCVGVASFIKYNTSIRTRSSILDWL